MGGDQPNLWRAFHVGGLYNTGKVHWALALESLTSLATGSPDREVMDPEGTNVFSSSYHFEMAVNAVMSPVQGHNAEKFYNLINICLFQNW